MNYRNFYLKVLFALALSLGVFQPVLRADVIEHKNGQRIYGKIISETASVIVVEIDGAKLSLNKDEIRSIKKEEMSAPSHPNEIVPQVKIPNEGLEKPLIPFDKRKWKVGYQASADKALIVEFVLENETVEHWTELVTAHLFLFDPAQHVTAKRFLDTQERVIKQAYPVVQWNAIQSSENGALYEWSVKGYPGMEDQSEIARIIKGKDGIHNIRYTAKKVPLPPEQRKDWIDRLSKITLEKSRR